ncbi:MAG: hypothetical protein M1822_002172 [Bathelium mastoideum]|nr:MAG: hypothetical protein M1822_002172 [Bathelium mastoideum]
MSPSSGAAPRRDGALLTTTASSSHPRPNPRRPEPLHLTDAAAFPWGITARLFRPRTVPKRPASRLANPINYAPRSQTLPNLPVIHPQLQEREPPRPTEGRVEYPLLTLPEKRRSRVSASGSVVVLPSPTAESGRSSIGLPRDKRISLDSRTRRNSAPGELVPPQPAQATERQEKLVFESSSSSSSNESRPRPKLDKGKAKAIDMPEGGSVPASNPTDPEKSAVAGDDVPLPPQPHATSSTDPNLEAGAQFRHAQAPSRISLPLSRRPSTLSRLTRNSATHPVDHDGTASAASEEAESYPWGPFHPCFPHPNPHRPLTSPLTASTRIIRIRRDYTAVFPPESTSFSPSKPSATITTAPRHPSSSPKSPQPVSDRVPAFTNLYPEILAPWVSEPAFRTLLDGVNSRYAKAFNPFSWRALVDLLLGLLTLWLWEDLGFTRVRMGVTEVEKFVEGWNAERRMEAEAAAIRISEQDEGHERTVEEAMTRGEASGGVVQEGDYARVINPRRTGFLCLDIEIPDPGIGAIEDEASALRLGEGGDAGAPERGAYPVRLASATATGENALGEAGVSGTNAGGLKAGIPDGAALQGQRMVEGT